MIKRLILCIIPLLLGLWLFAAEVPPHTAKQLAVNYMIHNAEKKLDAQLDVLAPITFMQKESTIPAFYIFNFEHGGFVIVAADDNIYPILGFSETQVLDTSRMAPALKQWLGDYVSQISYAVTHNTKAPEAHNAWQRFLSVNALSDKSKSVQLGPLMLTTWNQDNFYNALCPEDPAGPGGRVYAGCVATAMGQVMKYYNFPNTGTGFHSYNDWDYGYLEAEFGNTTYKWNHMSNSLNTHNHAVAELLFHCGVAVEMGYSPDGSGAYSEDVVTALKSYFGYSNNLNIKARNDYSDQQWINMLKANLDALMPMYYSGYSDEGGHAYNVDGYREDGSGTMFHLNWGWGGYGDGFFYINNLASPGGTFEHWHQAIFNIIPAQNYPANCTGITLIDGTAGTFDDGSGMYNYNNNVSCSWLINPAVNVVNIKLNFDRVDTEQNTDIITVYDGENTSAPILATFSGTTIPQQFVSTGKKLLVTFQTNATVAGAGWAASYTTTKPVYCNLFSILTDPSGTIADGSDTYNYNAGTNCRWKIAPPEAGTITVSFNSFDIQQGDDVFEVYDVSAQPYTLLDTYSGSQIPASKTYYASAILLWFKSQGAPKDGWEMNYTSTVASASAPGKDPTLVVYPNPASDEIILTAGETNETIAVEIFDARGKLIFNSNRMLTPANINIRHWANGLYHINTLKNDSKKSFRVLKL